MTTIPIYVTRQHGGKSAAYSIPAWLTMACLLVIAFNIMLWGLVGFYEAIKILADAF